MKTCKHLVSLILVLFMSVVALCGTAQAEETKELTLFEALEYVSRNADINVEMDVEFDKETEILWLRIPGKFYKLYSYKVGCTYLVDREDVEDVTSQIRNDWYCKPIELEDARTLIADLLGEEGWIVESSMDTLDDNVVQLSFEVWSGKECGLFTYRSLTDITCQDLYGVYFDAIEAFGW